MFVSIDMTTIDYIMFVMNKYVRAMTDNCMVMSRDEVRGFDSWAINTLRIPGVVLMENAGRGCAEVIVERLADIEGAKVCIFCGTGNNGGDGYVTARHLVNAGVKAGVVICGDKDRIKGDGRVNLEIIEQMDVSIDRIDMTAGRIAGQVKTFAHRCDMLVDAIFGTGLKGDLGVEYAELIESINAQNIPIVAVDIPSGLDCDAGGPLGVSIKAAVTVTFVAVKKGFTNPDAVNYTGDIFIASIGIEPKPGFALSPE